MSDDLTPRCPYAVIVLAAGAGTRMKSATPKVLHEIGGRSLVGHALLAARGTQPEHLVAVVRHEREAVAEHISRCDADALIADQDDIPGTGRAVLCGLEALEDHTDVDVHGTIVVTYGDVPLLTTQTLTELIALHETEGNAVTVVTAELDDPTGYGRIVRSDDGDVESIVEHKDATVEQRQIREVNSGIYAFDAAMLARVLPTVGQGNTQGEVYLTDVLELARKEDGRVHAFVISDVAETEGINDRAQMAAQGRALADRVIAKHHAAGVTIIDPATTWIDDTVTIEPDVIIKPGVQLHGQTSIATGAVIGPDTTLTDVVVGARANVVRTHGSESTIGVDTNVGPFAYLRPGTALGDGGKIGTFVETKNATIGTGSKVPHLTYVGDATIGEHSNIGAASVFVNYDGVNKHHTTIGSHCRTGSDNMFVAPVTIGDGAYTGAGTVVRDDVPPGDLAINVAPQRNISGWVEKKRPDSPAAQAAARSRGVS